MDHEPFAQDLPNATPDVVTTTGGKKKTPFPPFVFAPPDYSNFAQQTGFGYGSLFDQMKDSFQMPTHGGGVFMGNKAPRYGGPAPNMTMPGGFLGLLQQFIKPQQGPQGAPQDMTRPAGGLLAYQGMRK